MKKGKISTFFALTLRNLHGLAIADLIAVCHL
jgi:hypothetical protein